jgi:hypothetical protein
MTNIFLPGPSPNTVRSADGKVLNVPKDWTLILPGDAALTRRVKRGGRTLDNSGEKGPEDFFTRSLGIGGNY